MKPTTTKPDLFALLSIATSILIMASCTNSEKNNDWKQYNLSGNVKSFKQTVYDAEEKFGEIEKGDISYRNAMNKRVISQNDRNKQVIFNQKGNTVEENGYDSDGDLNYKILYKYDKQGNIIEWKQYDTDESLSSKGVPKYDKQGNIVEWKQYDADGNLQYKRLIDKQGNIIEWNEYDADGNLEYKILYKYDENGNSIEEIANDFSGKSDEYKYEYEFDNKGNWINRLGFRNNIPKEITEREIEYFN